MIFTNDGRFHSPIPCLLVYKIADTTGDLCLDWLGSPAAAFGRLASGWQRKVVVKGKPALEQWPTFSEWVIGHCFSVSDSAVLCQLAVLPPVCKADSISKPQPRLGEYASSNHQCGVINSHSLAGPATAPILSVPMVWWTWTFIMIWSMVNGCQSVPFKPWK